jgi:hypothetical protein
MKRRPLVDGVMEYSNPLPATEPEPEPEAVPAG